MYPHGNDAVRIFWNRAEQERSSKTRRRILFTVLVMVLSAVVTAILKIF